MWREKHIAMNRALTISTVAGVLQFIALAISLAVVSSSAKPSEELQTIASKAGKKINGDAICSTPGCSREASRILKNMNPKIAPCDNFYEFACGGFEQSTTIPDDEDIVDTFSISAGQLEEQLKAVIEEVSGPDEPRPFTLVKNLYKSCMNEAAIEEAGLEPLFGILKQLGGWPVLEGDNWKDDEFQLLEVVGELPKLGYGVYYFINFGIDVNSANSTERVIYLDQASPGLSLTYLSNGMEDEMVEAYYDYMVDIAVMLGADPQRAAQELRESLEFEIKLASFSLLDEERQDETSLYNPTSIAELNERYPIANWVEYINNILPPGVRVDENETVIVVVPSFISNLEELLRTTPKRVQSNYLVWRVVAESVGYLTEDMRKRKLEYTTVVRGEQETVPKWAECLSFVHDNLPIGISALYVRKYFGKDAKNTASGMVSGIKTEFRNILNKTKWMDRKTRNRALKKIASMSSYVGYPEELLDDEILKEFYAPLELSANDFFKNMLNSYQLTLYNSFKGLRKPVNKGYWTRHSEAANVDAYYIISENKLSIPAGILQGAFFSMDRPQYMNYGAIGSIMGHEMTHGFDDIGSQFDKDGNPADWWAPDTKENFFKEAECIINQYGNYTEQSVGLKLNGINTQGEDIADNGGCKVAYLAYKEWVKQNGAEPTLPGLKYTPAQMFWIATANVWCGKYRPEFLRLRIETDVHSTAQFRVIGPFSNNPEFATDFNCPVGSAMNPEHKCSVW